MRTNPNPETCSTFMVTRAAWRPILPGLCLLLLAVLGALWAVHAGAASAEPAEEEAPKDAHGAPAESAGDEAESGGGHGEAEGKTPAELPPVYELGELLNGYFDYHVLRSTNRVHPLRYDLEAFSVSISESPRRQAEVHLNLVVEFGRESGMAELERDLALYREDISRIIRRFRILDLLTVRGKQQLKEAMIASMNRRLTTARVREVYFTEFRVMFG